MRVLLIGASGMFGKRLAELLSAQEALTLILSGRRTQALEQQRQQLSPKARAPIETCLIDINDPKLCDVIAAIRPDVIVDTCGPFQHRDRKLARLAIAQRAHYLDLADAPEAVASVHELNAGAVAADVLVASGASSVPALSSAVLDAYRDRFASLIQVDIGIVPGNRAERGLATVRSILAGAGKPHVQFRHGQKWMPTSWSGLRRHRYAQPIGPRWLALCPVPDPLVLPARYSGLQSLQFRAGLELHRMHFGLWIGALLVRMGVIRSLEPWAEWARDISDRWLQAGSDQGGMHVSMHGTGHDSQRLHLEWQLLAEHGDGPFVATAAAATLVRKLGDGSCTARGAMPCVGLMRLDEIQSTLSEKAIRYVEHS